MWIPESLAHGFIVLTGTDQVFYKFIDYWLQEHEWCIAWNANLASTRPIHGKTVLSMKDAQGKLFAETELFS